MFYLFTGTINLHYLFDLLFEIISYQVFIVEFIFHKMHALLLAHEMFYFVTGTIVFHLHKYCYVHVHACRYEVIHLGTTLLMKGHLKQFTQYTNSLKISGWRPGG